MILNSSTNHISLPQRQRAPRGSRKVNCSKCKSPLEETRVGKQSYCKKCHAAYARATRPKYSLLTEEEKKKVNARGTAKVYQDRGKIIKKPCEHCGSDNSERHHEDYDKPLEISWLCRPCHLALHKRKKLSESCCRNTGEYNQ